MFLGSTSVEFLTHLRQSLAVHGTVIIDTTMSTLSGSDQYVIRNSDGSVIVIVARSRN